MIRIIIILLSLCSFGLGGTTWLGEWWSVSTAIPDDEGGGVTDTRTIALPGGESIIESVSVNLEIAGTWNGDLYVYLAHNGSLAVLLNRPGRSLEEPAGSGAMGMNIMIADEAAEDIHTGMLLDGGEVVGTWQPDGRETDPKFVYDTDPRTAMLSSFAGLDANGAWTLFVADQATGETSTLVGWSLTIVAVPESSAVGLALFGLMVICRRQRRAV